MNRFLRRMQRFGKSFSARRSHAEAMREPAEPPPDPRKKSSRHGGMTADKWNQ